MINVIRFVSRKKQPAVSLFIVPNVFVLFPETNWTVLIISFNSLISFVLFYFFPKHYCFCKTTIIMTHPLYTFLNKVALLFVLNIPALRKGKNLVEFSVHMFWSLPLLITTSVSTPNLRQLMRRIQFTSVRVPTLCLS